AGAEIENLQHARLPRDDVRHTDSVGIDEVRAEFAGTLGAQGRKPNKLQSEVREGYDSADSTHALRAKGGTNRSKSRCQCRRSARILVAQASCVQVARLPSLAANTLLPLLKRHGAKSARYRRHTGQLWLPSVSRKSQRTPFFFSTSTNCRLFCIRRSSLPHAIQSSLSFLFVACGSARALPTALSGSRTKELNPPTQPNNS